MTESLGRRDVEVVLTKLLEHQRGVRYIRQSAFATRQAQCEWMQVKPLRGKVSWEAD